jgi:hypothetical protein
MRIGHFRQFPHAGTLRTRRIGIFRTAELQDIFSLWEAHCAHV